MCSKTQGFYGSQEDITDFAEGLLGIPLTDTQKTILTSAEQIAGFVEKAPPLPVRKNGFHSDRLLIISMS